MCWPQSNFFMVYSSLVVILKLFDYLSRMERNTPQLPSYLLLPRRPQRAKKPFLGVLIPAFQRYLLVLALLQLSSSLLCYGVPG